MQRTNSNSDNSNNNNKKMRTPNTTLKSPLSYPLTVNIPTKHSYAPSYYENLEDPVEIIPRLYLGSASSSRNKGLYTLEKEIAQFD